MITIDGSSGEGGGQILRTALALSLVTQQPFRIHNIRAGRPKSGLLRQHLTAVEAATQIGNATVENATLGSKELIFKPGKVQAGNYRFAVGTAGSTTLVLQTVLPALILGEDQTRLTLEGGTHNPHAPPFDFLVRTYLPLLDRMGPKISSQLERAGFHPAGGGRFSVEINPAPKLEPLVLETRGQTKGRSARALISNLSPSVAERELKIVSEKLGWSSDCLRVENVESNCSGNILLLEIVSENVTETFTGFGERGVPAEMVAGAAVQQAREYIAAGAPVGEYLADQLLIPLALAGAGRFRTGKLSRHARTNIEVISKFLALELKIELQEAGVLVKAAPERET